MGRDITQSKGLCNHNPSLLIRIESHPNYALTFPAPPPPHPTFPELHEMNQSPCVPSLTWPPDTPDCVFPSDSALNKISLLLCTFLYVYFSALSKM